jgi:hypothetical protein
MAAVLIGPTTKTNTKQQQQQQRGSGLLSNSNPYMITNVTNIFICDCLLLRLLIERQYTVRRELQNQSKLKTPSLV